MVDYANLNLRRRFLLALEVEEPAVIAMSLDHRQMAILLLLSVNFRRDQAGKVDAVLPSQLLSLLHLQPTH